MYSAQLASPENASRKVIGWSDEDQANVEMLARLPLVSATAAQVDRYLRVWVGLIRERHISYAEIGKALGVSRQAAWERFSRVTEPAATNGDAAAAPQE
ncbi:MAG TPA: hypothetical protein DEQ43_25580 [Nocardioides bacterium]|nr:hypothetical protein [Nocardioides sp.]